MREKRRGRRDEREEKTREREREEKKREEKRKKTRERRERWRGKKKRKMWRCDEDVLSQVLFLEEPYAQVRSGKIEKIAKFQLHMDGIMALPLIPWFPTVVQLKTAASASKFLEPSGNSGTETRKTEPATTMQQPVCDTIAMYFAELHTI